LVGCPAEVGSPGTRAEFGPPTAAVVEATCGGTPSPGLCGAWSTEPQTAAILRRRCQALALEDCSSGGFPAATFVWLTDCATGVDYSKRFGRPYASDLARVEAARTAATTTPQEEGVWTVLVWNMGLGSPGGRNPRDNWNRL
jgi:hypothetical protein